MNSTPPVSAAREASQSAQPAGHSVIEAAWARFRGLAKAEQKEELVSDLAPVMERFALGIFRLVVMGEIKKGKSSFINALLAEPDLLPTASDVATATVYKLIYGPQKRFKVFFQPDTDTGRRREPLEIAATDLVRYGTEDGNPGNRERVDFIGIELPHVLLKQGLVIVDTPGVGGLFKAHHDITWRYAPNADAICFVLDSVEAVISKDELDFLKELSSQVTKRIFFVQTKTDAAGSEQWRAWESRNRQLLSQHLGIAPTRMLYFPVSATRKANADKKSRDGAVGKEDLMRSLERSGFLKLTRFLNQGLLRQKEKQVAQETARQLLAGCAALERELAGQQQIVKAGSKEELDRYARQFAESQQALVVWERTTCREETQRFDDQFTDLKQAALTRLQNELDPTGPIVSQVIDKLRSTEFNPEDVNAMAGRIQQECLGKASQVVTDAQAAFNQQALTLISDTAGRLAKGFKIADGDHPLQAAGVPAIKIEDTLHLQFSGFENLRNMFYGGMAGSAIASLGLGLLTVVFPPVGAAAMLVTMLGAFLGGREAIKLQTQRKRQEAIQALSNLLAQTVAKALNQAGNQFTENATLLQRKARETFQQATERARTELQSRLKDVEEARTRSRKDAEAKARESEAKLKTVRSITASLTSILPRQRAPAVPPPQAVL